jgi:hypothetical protein
MLCHVYLGRIEADREHTHVTEKAEALTLPKALYQSRCACAKLHLVRDLGLRPARCDEMRRAGSDVDHPR